MRKYEVGGLFEDGVTSYPETVRFDFTQSGPVLLVFFAEPTQKEIESVKSGRFEAAFYAQEQENIIFFLAKFAGQPWMDAPYSVHLSKPFEFIEMTETQGFGLHIFLIDAATGIIKAMRLIGLPHNFSVKLRQAIEEQRKKPFIRAKYDIDLSYLYGNYNTDDFAGAADARCRIG